MLDVFEVQIFNKESVRVHDADHAYFSETSQNMLIYFNINCCLHLHTCLIERRYCLRDANSLRKC